MRSIGPRPNVPGALVAAALVLVTLARATDAADPWVCLEEIRSTAAERPLRADFTQDFVPAGFTGGERESGTFSLDLPRCLRWDYRNPYPRSFLLCDEIVYSWNIGESSGRRNLLASGDEPGLDLLRLEVESLRRRYSATDVATEVGEREIRLQARDEKGTIREARLRSDRECRHLLELRYLDLERNLSVFQFSGYRNLTEEDAFRPPTDLQWIDD